MTEVPDYVPMLIKGCSETPEQGGCLVQVANWLANPKTWTDDALCVDPVLADWGVTVNDNIGDEMRHRLALCAPRISGTKIHDVEMQRLVHQALNYWLEKGAGSGLPVYLHPAGSTLKTEGKHPTLTIHTPYYVLTGGEEYAVQWYEALVAHFEMLTAREPAELPATRWRRVKELVGQ